MARVNGQLRTCDRCGKEMFLKTIGDGETDGGYTRWNKFEDAVDWTSEYGIGDLCPECSEAYKNMKKEFLQNLGRGA